MEAHGMAKQFEDRQPSSTEDGGRRVVASAFVTLDGYMVGPDEDMSWVAAGFDREMQADIADAMSRESDAFVFGRVTYEIFAAYWPNALPYEEGDELKPAEGKEVLGDGKPLFASGTDRQDLKLASIKPYANGAVAMTYRRKAVA
jgi:dihydrofolate reductase